jgi:hypothetical protein
MNFNQKFKTALTKAFNKEVSMGYDPSDAFKSSAKAKKMIKNGEEDEMEVEGEMEEATGSGSAGGYSVPLFGTIKKENVTEMTTTSSSGSYVYSNVKEGKKNKKQKEGKKVEATEATTTASSGAYSGPAFLAKNKKNWRGGTKPIYSGGQFVQVKKRCKTFPYCNQGDIKALKLTENRLLAEAVENVSKKTGLSQEMILNMILKEIGK